jgi:hypothetical protein
MEDSEFDPYRYGDELGEFMPAHLPTDVERDGSGDVKVDKDFAFARLQMACQGKDILRPEDRTRHVGRVAGGAYYKWSNHETNTRIKLLAIPVGRVTMHHAEIFVAINARAPHPNPTMYDHERLSMQGYRVSLHANRIVRSPLRISEKDKRESSWPVREDEGPFIAEYEDGRMIQLVCWNLDRDLPFPKWSFQRSSRENFEQIKLAYGLGTLLHGLDDADKQLFTYGGIRKQRK